MHRRDDREVRHGCQANRDRRRAGLAAATPAQADMDVTATPVADAVELSSTVPGHRYSMFCPSAEPAIHRVDGWVLSGGVYGNALHESAVAGVRPKSLPPADHPSGLQATGCQSGDVGTSDWT